MMTEEQAEESKVQRQVIACLKAGGVVWSKTEGGVLKKKMAAFAQSINSTDASRVRVSTLRRMEDEGLLEERSDRTEVYWVLPGTKVRATSPSAPQSPPVVRNSGSVPGCNCAVCTPPGLVFSATTTIQTT